MSSIQAGFMRQLLAYAVQAGVKGPIKVKADLFNTPGWPVFKSIQIVVGNIDLSEVTITLFQAGHGDHGRVRLWERDRSGGIGNSLEFASPTHIDHAELLDYVETILTAAGQHSVAELFASVEPVEETK